MYKQRTLFECFSSGSKRLKLMAQDSGSENESFDSDSHGSQQVD